VRYRDARVRRRDLIRKRKGLTNYEGPRVNPCCELLLVGERDLGGHHEEVGLIPWQNPSAYYAALAVPAADFLTRSTIPQAATGLASNIPGRSRSRSLQVFKLRFVLDPFGDHAHVSEWASATMA